jgi:hypothetical protein
MNIQLSLAPLVSLIAGILILIMPRLLNYIVAVYLIVIGLIGLFGAGNFNPRWNRQWELSAIRAHHHLGSLWDATKRAAHFALTVTFHLSLSFIFVETPAE